MLPPATRAKGVAAPRPVSYTHLDVYKRQAQVLPIAVEREASDDLPGGDALLVLDYHRHFTHALAFVPFGALIAALLLWPCLLYTSRCV